MGPQDKQESAAIQRELTHMYARLDNVEKKQEAQRAEIVDVQVRVAQLEAIDPVSKDEFEPVRRLVWGFVGTVLAVVLVALLAIVVNKSGQIINVKPL